MQKIRKILRNVGISWKFFDCCKKAYKTTTNDRLILSNISIKLYFLEPQAFITCLRGTLFPTVCITNSFRSFFLVISFFFQSVLTAIDHWGMENCHLVGIDLDTFAQKCTSDEESDRELLLELILFSHVETTLVIK